MSMTLSERVRDHAPLALTVFFAAGLLPTLRVMKLPLRFDWGTYFRAYWMGLALKSLFATALLVVIGFPYAEGFGPLLDRYRRQKLRFLFLLPLVLLLCLLNGPLVGLLLSVDAIALLEYLDRLRESQTLVTAAAQDILIPATLLFFGLIVVFGYNDVIAVRRDFAPQEYWLNRLDSLLLGGATIPALAHRAFAAWGAQAFRALDFIYFEMFPQIGAALTLTAVRLGRRRAMRFVGTILLAYYIALVCFWLVPATGPYFICPDHFAVLPRGQRVYAVQAATLANLHALWSGNRKERIGLDYFIALPCMHITQPLIVMWFLRPWKRILAVLATFNVLVAASTLLLEQHYLVDLLGGVATALLAIALMDGPPGGSPGSKESAGRAGNGK
jgi:PAP2 superfamily protein